MKKYNRTTKYIDLADLNSGLINEEVIPVNPDGLTFWTAIEAASFWMCHFREAQVVKGWLEGRLEWSWGSHPLEPYAEIWRVGEDFGWAIWLGCGLALLYEDGQLWLWPSRESAHIIERSGVRYKILAEEPFAVDAWTRRTPTAACLELVEQLREESKIVYHPRVNGVVGFPFGREEYGFWTSSDGGDEGDYWWTNAEAKRFINAAWVHYKGRAPKSYDLVGDRHPDTTELVDIGRYIEKVNLKAWLKYARKTPFADDGTTSAHDRIAQLRSCGKWSAASLDQLVKYAESWNQLWETYRAVPENRVQLLAKSRRQEYVRALGVIPEDTDLSKMRVDEVVELGGKYRYSAVSDEAVAWAASLAGLSEAYFTEFQKYWIGRQRKESESIPSVGSLSLGGYTMYRLDDDDPRGPLLGVLTNCCQHPKGAGASCAKHGMENPDGAFFLVERQGKIIAQSWAWRVGEVVCFDNVEVLSGDYLPTVAELYQKTADRMIGKLGICQVNVGAGYDGLGVSKYWPKVTATPTPRGPEWIYTDADVQHLIARKEASNENA